MFITAKTGEKQSWRLCCSCYRMFRADKTVHDVLVLNGMMFVSHDNCPPLKESLVQPIDKSNGRWAI